MKKILILLPVILITIGTAAQSDKYDSVASLNIMPFQNNVNYRIGTYHASKYTLNFNPVVLFQPGSKLHLIT
jgi:hypothetical protein